MADDFDRPIERDFRLGEAVGRGAFGEVLRAVETASGATVAVKRLLDNTPDPAAEQRFRREARLLARVQSPHVVAHRAHGRDDAGRLCLVLEWLEGEDLLHRQRRAPLSPAEAVEFARQAALGLDAVHAAGIVHRDVKPSNFYLLAAPTSGSSVKLLDLGIAHIEQDVALTTDAFLIGTPAYMSPEQARGEQNLTLRTDLYSLGVVLYELLAGVKPFRHRDPFALLTKIILQDPPPLREKALAVWPALEHTVLRAMARDARARFASALEMASALAAATVVTDPSTLIPPSVSADHSAQPHGPLGEQRIVTALFAGIEQGADVEAHTAAFESLVREHGGVVHRVLGRGAVGVFGQDRSVGDEPLRAARAGLVAVRAVPSARVAIATCRIRVGVTGLPDEAIERGVALLAFSPGILRADAPSARMLESHFDVVSQGEARVVHGERSPDRDVAPRLMGRPTRMVGRDRELATLLALFHESADESVVRAALVTAPPGAGKSRLRYETLQRACGEREGVTVLVARGDPMRAGSPHALIAQALRLTSDVRDGEAPEAQRDKLASRVARSVPRESRTRVTEFLGELAGVNFPDAHSPQLRAARQDPRLMADQQRRAWGDFLTAECALGPVVLLLEDLHWGDWPSVKLVDDALGTSDSSPLFVLALARPELHERFPGLWSGRDVQEIRLGELSRKAAESLVRDALGERATASMIHRLVEHAAGNAFYLEELVRAAAEAQDRGGEAALPETVLMMVQARLERFEPEARELLRAASVFGQTFWRAGVATVLGNADRTGTPDAWLAELGAREVLLARGEGRFPGQREYTFRHAILREAAYAMLTERDRASAHSTAAQWLEEAGERDPVVLAGHHEHGTDPLRAAPWWVRAAAQALDANDLDAVISHAARAEACGASGELLGTLDLVLAEAHRLRGELSKLEQRALEAFVLLPRGSKSWFGAVHAIGILAMPLGRKQWLEELIEELDALWDEHGTTPGYHAALAQTVVSMCALGLTDEAEGPSRKLEAVARSFDEIDVVAARTIRHALAARALHRGDLGGNLEWLFDTLPLLQRAGDVRGVCQIQTQLGYGYITLGAYAQAVPVLREALVVAERLRLVRFSAVVKNNLGYALARLGEVEEGRRVEHEAMTSFHAQGDLRLEGSSRFYLARILEASGDVDGAEREARLAEKQLEKAPPLRCGVLAVIARLARQRGDLDEAGRFAQEAMSVLATHGSEAEEGLVRLEYVEWLEAVGRQDEARAALRTARTVLEERAARITDARLRESFLRGDPDHARLMQRSDVPAGVA